MTTSSLQERFARLGPVKEIARVPSGSPEDVLLIPLGPVLAITASQALSHRGLSLLKAKRAVEAMLAEGKALLHLPTVEDRATLIHDLAAAGITCKIRTLPDEMQDGILKARLPALRARLGMTQEQFALQFGFELKTLRGWEQGRKVDKAILSYIRVIDHDPETVAKITDSV